MSASARLRLLLFALMLAAVAAPASAAESAAYAPARVVYDVSSGDPAEFKRLLDRVNLLQALYGSDPFAASIVLVIHEGAIPLLAKRARQYRADLDTRAQDLAMGEVIHFRICQASAGMQGYSRPDFRDFITLVPMADAELVRLQHDGYAYVK